MLCCVEKGEQGKVVCYYNLLVVVVAVSGYSLGRVN